ncbi:hypothetical protein M0R89_02175 [Halorussus limi]|uniref:Uncharacterized protein n=1 Tax=Halorussus limi TaxID=2938695 RepID=A0A8U0HVL3_9EURY|nr:hypothetical protein [Halorussus limi]UPV74889.1 hypothetical protein M0R89_02175 [Halorussus limi]
MPSRRKLLRRVGGVAAVGTVLGGAAHLDVGFVRTKLGGSFGGGIDLESPDDEAFVPPAEFAAYADRTRERYGDAALPWTAPESLAGEFVGAYTRREAVVPDERFAVQDAAVFVHRLDGGNGTGDSDDTRRGADARYRLRLWSAGRLLGRSYGVDPWGVYREDPAFTWLTQEVEAERDDQLSANRALSTGGGRVSVAGATATVPNGSYEMGLESDTRYRTRWDGFYRGAIPLVGTCEASFADGEARRLDWTLSNGVGIRTPF